MTPCLTLRSNQPNAAASLSCSSRSLPVPVQDAVLGLGLADYPLGDVDDVVHRQLARQSSLRHRLDESIIVPGLAQKLLVIEEHARFGVLGDAVDAVRTFYRLPERRKDRAEILRVFSDIIVELERKAFLLKGADPFMCGDEHIRALADTEYLEELQRIIVEARGRAFVHCNLHALAGAFSPELLVEPIRCLHHIGRTQWPRRVLARPQLEFDDVLRQRRCRREDWRRADRQSGNQ
jgi:hypothetical protein